MRKKNRTVGFVIFQIVVGVIFVLIQMFGLFDSNNSTSSSSSKKDNKIKQPEFKVQWPTPLNETKGEKVSDKLNRKNYYIVFDGSGSMRERRCSGDKTKEEVAKKALNNFVQQISDDDNIGLYIFDNNESSQRVALGHHNKTQIIEEIQKSTAGGHTPLKTAMAKGVTELAKQSGKQLEYGEYHLVIITDGEASRYERPESVVNVSLSKTPIVIHSIGFCISEKHSLNQPGKTLYKSADNPQELLRGLESVLAESEEFVVTDFED